MEQRQVDQMKEQRPVGQNTEQRPVNPYALWLTGIEGVGGKTIRALMRRASGAEEVYNMSEEEIRRCLSETMKKQADAVRMASRITRAHRERPEEQLGRLYERGIRFVSVEDDFFPDRLREIPDCPYGIYYIGKLPPEDRPSVAIVGARNCSGYGREQARIFAEKLALRGISIVSGMARGVDGIAGRSAVTAGGDSFAVLGCGVDVIYPPENTELYHMLRERGGIISESQPGAEPRTPLFPRRNRLISGLADAVLVIEARRRSGTVITVDAALEQGREIFALPGRVSDRLSDGCNLLISQGATIACTPDMLVEYFYGVTDSGTDLSEQNRIARNCRGRELYGLEAVLFDVLGCGEIMEAEYLRRRAERIIQHRVSVEEFVACMVSLQIKGLAAEIGAGHYKGI